MKANLQWECSVCVNRWRVGHTDCLLASLKSTQPKLSSVTLDIYRVDINIWGQVFQLLPTTKRNEYLKGTLCLILDIWEYLCQGEMNCASKNLFFPYMETPYCMETSYIYQPYTIKTLFKRSYKESLDNYLVWQISSVETRTLSPHVERKTFLTTAFSAHSMSFYYKGMIVNPFHEGVAVL